MYIGLQVSVSGLKAGSYILVGIGPEPVFKPVFPLVPARGEHLAAPVDEHGLYAGEAKLYPYETIL